MHLPGVELHATCDRQTRSEDKPLLKLVCLLAIVLASWLAPLPAYAESPAAPGDTASAKTKSAKKAPARNVDRLLAAPRGDQTADANRSPTLRTWGFIGVGAGSAALATALTYELLRQKAEHDAQNARSRLEYSEQYERMQSRKQRARVFAGTGTALLLGGGALISIDLAKRSKRGEPQRVSRLSLDCGMRGCSTSWNGKF